MDRREKVLGGLDVAKLSGIEIGALAWPIVAKSDGDVTYVDFTDAETLRRNHAVSGHVPIDYIVEVDAIWGSNTLQQAIGEHRKVDYVVASHVVEHVPDLLEWLVELREVLKPDGQIRLVVPDRRFTFDYLRHETQAEDVLAAHAIKARVPQPQQILQYFLSYVELDRKDAWEGRLDGLMPRATIQRAMALVELSLGGEYVDVHCWVFTPKSMGTLFVRLAKDGLIDLACTHFHDTAYGEYEFFIGLRPCDDREQVVRSWEAMAASAVERPNPAIGKVENKAAVIAELTSETARLAEVVRTAESETARLAEAVRTAESQRDAAAAEAAALRASTSWALTKPLRALSTRLRG